MAYKPSRLEEWKEYLGDWIKYFGYGYENTKKVTAENTIILVLDPLEIYRNLFNKQNIDSITNLVLYAEKFKIPVVYTNWVRTRGLVNDQMDRKGHWSEFVPGYSSILSELPRVNNIIHTIHTDAFATSWDLKKKTNIDNELKRIIGNRKNIVICGSWTEACVLTTARSAAHKNLNPIVYKPGTVGHGRASSNAFLMIDKLYGYVVNGISFL